MKFSCVVTNIYIFATKKGVKSSLRLSWFLEQWIKLAGNPVETRCPDTYSQLAWIYRCCISNPLLMFLMYLSTLVSYLMGHKPPRGCDTETLVPLFPTYFPTRVNDSLTTFQKTAVNYIPAITSTIDSPSSKQKITHWPLPCDISNGGSVWEGSEVEDGERVDGHLFFHNGYGQ